MDTVDAARARSRQHHNFEPSNISHLAATGSDPNVQSAHRNRTITLAGVVAATISIVTRTLVVLVLVGAGVVCVGVSATTNYQFAVANTDDHVLGTAWALLAVAASLLAALSFPGLAWAIERRQYSRLLPCVLGIVLCGGYSLSCALGAASGVRTDATTIEQDLSGKRARAQATYDRLDKELKALPHTRPAAEVQSELSIVLAREPSLTNNCETKWLTNVGMRALCLERVVPLKAELARAQRRETLDGELRQARAGLDGERSVRTANSDVASIVGMLADIGIAASPERVSRWMVIIKALVIEAGGGIAFAMAELFCLPRMVPTAASTPAVAGTKPETPPETSPEPRSEPAKAPLIGLIGLIGSSDRLAEPEIEAPATDPNSRILALLETEPGLTQRELARRIGLSQPSICQRVAALVKAGKLTRAGNGYLVSLSRVEAAPDQGREPAAEAGDRSLSRLH